MNERRQHPRHEIRLSAEVRTPARTFAAVTRDLSLGGCCIEGAYRLDEGAEIVVALFLVIDGIEQANMPPLETRARIQWTAEAEDAPLAARHLCGVRFVGMNEAQIAWLGRFVGSG
jgi:hypothetical protein